MKPKGLILPLISLSILASAAQNVYHGKDIYIPNMAVAHDSSKADEEIWAGWIPSKWDFSRMISTENVVLFWAPEFGPNVATAPDLIEVKENGDTIRHNMKVDVANLMEKLEHFYKYFNEDLAFTKKGSKAEKYKMMVMLDYSLEGTAYGGEYDNTIGALWVTPGRLQDEKLNCIAHELGHSFQSQISCDGEGEAWGGAGIFEMASQWMLWQVNPDWQTDENYHLNDFRRLTHKAFLHIDNIYHSPYVLELWGERHGLPFIAELFRQGKPGEDPTLTYQRLTGVSQKEFNDEMWHNYARLINWDIERVRDNARPYANLWNTKMVDLKGGWQRVAADNAPENYGFNALEVALPAAGTKVTADFRGETGVKGYYTPNPKEAGWRYGFVACLADGKTVYGDMQSDRNGQASIIVPEGTEHLWFVVMGAPTKHRMNVDGPDNPGDAQWPWKVRISPPAP